MKNLARKINGMVIKDLGKYNYLFIILLLSCLLAEAQNAGSPESNFRNNIIKLNLLPIIPAINGNNQKWIGIEYERFLNQRMSVSAMVDVGLFEDYTFIKYHDFFDENGGFSYTQQKAKTWGYHFIPSFKYYFLITKKKKGQGFYVAGNLDFNQYFKKTEDYQSQYSSYNYTYSSTTRMGAGATLGGQYVVFSRLVVDLNISIFTTLFSINQGEDATTIKPLHAIWTFNNDQSWGTVNLMIGYAFGGGKKE